MNVVFAHSKGNTVFPTLQKRSRFPDPSRNWIFVHPRRNDSMIFSARGERVTEITGNRALCSIERNVQQYGELVEISILFPRGHKSFLDTRIPVNSANRCFDIG